MLCIKCTYSDACDNMCSDRGMLSVATHKHEEHTKASKASNGTDGSIQNTYMLHCNTLNHSAIKQTHQ